MIQKQPKRRKYRTKARVRFYSPWNMTHEVGDVCVDPGNGRAYRLEVSASWCKRNRGELYPRTIKPPHPDCRAELIDGAMYWVWPSKEQKGGG